MRITEKLKKSCVRVPLEATEKTAAITELVDLLRDDGAFEDRDAVLRAVLAREQTRSTGIGQGLAVPHGKTPACGSLVMAVGKPHTPIDFGSDDGKACDIVVLLVSPVDKTGPHIQALAGVSRLWQNSDFRSSVLRSSTADELFAAIEKHEN